MDKLKGKKERIERLEEKGAHIHRENRQNFLMVPKKIKMYRSCSTK